MMSPMSLLKFAIIKTIPITKSLKLLWPEVVSLGEMFLFRHWLDGLDFKM